MGIDSDQVDVVTFDSFSTLVDPRSAGRVLEGYVDDPPAVAAEWHSLAVQFATVAAHVGANPTYYDLHRDALAYLLEARGVSVAEAALGEMTDVYHDLSPFDDVRPGLASLSSAGYRIAVLSNGNPAMLESLVETTNTDEFVEATISAATVGTFKPDPGLYESAADSLGVPIERAVHVGAGWGDIVGCTNAGMRGVWLNRAGAPWPRFDGEPDAVADSMPEVVALLTDD
jgi:2-haloacid dehalogenase